MTIEHCHDSNQVGDSPVALSYEEKPRFLTLSCCFAKSLHLAQPCYDLVPTRNALGRQLFSGILMDARLPLFSRFRAITGFKTNYSLSISVF